VGCGLGSGCGAGCGCGCGAGCGTGCGLGWGFGCGFGCGFFGPGFGAGFGAGVGLWPPPAAGDPDDDGDGVPPAACGVVCAAEPVPPDGCAGVAPGSATGPLGIVGMCAGTFAITIRRARGCVCVGVGRCVGTGSGAAWMTTTGPLAPPAPPITLGAAGGSTTMRCGCDRGAAVGSGCVRAPDQRRPAAAADAAPAVTIRTTEARLTTVIFTVPQDGTLSEARPQPPSG
jgi:hypothetical protein